MTTVHIRKQGGAAIITIPAYILETLHLSIGNELSLDVMKNSFVAKPTRTRKRKRYSVAELFKGVTLSEMKKLNKRTAHLREGKPFGREIA